MTRKELILSGLIVVIFVLLVVGYRAARSGWYAEYRERQSKLTRLNRPFQSKLTVNDVLATLHDRIWAERKEDMSRCGFDDWPEQLTLIVVKSDWNMEMWGRNSDGAKWCHICDYPMTASSGAIGPKLKEGDGQIPEGIYAISFLNPNSNYHLSIMIDYPNAFDREKGRLDGRTNLGGEIFIHGNAVTIGCIPIGDRPIEEVFTAAGMCGLENTTVIIVPVDFRKGYPEPRFDYIDWEQELYSILKEKLMEFTEADSTN